MLQICRNRRIGMMIRKVAVHIEEQLGYLAVQALQQAVKEGSSGAVAGVGDYFNAPRKLKLRSDGIEIGVGDVDCFVRAFAGREIAGFDELEDVLNRFAMQCAGATNSFESVKLSRIVAPGDHDRAVGFKMNGRKIQQWGRNDANIGDVTDRGEQAFEQSVMQARRTKAAIAAKVNTGSAFSL